VQLSRSKYFTKAKITMPNAAQVSYTVICRRHLLDLLVTTRYAQKHARRQNGTVDFYVERV